MEFSEAAFASLAFYSALLGAKMLFMSHITSLQRFSRKAFENPEDLKMGNDSKLKVKQDESVERVRRAHRNDMENIFVFFALAAFYVTTGPSAATANWLFRIFTIARYVHTFVYVNAVPQPARALSYTVGAVINAYMAYAVAAHYF